MTMWQTAEEASWNLKGMNSLGKNLEEKITPEITAELKECFSVYELNSCWKSLFSMIELFESTSKELSLKLKIEFPEKEVNKILKYINKIKNGN
jgi:Ca2+-binding EF-hand superfamily protein